MVDEEPKNVDDELTDVSWKDAMEEEINLIRENTTLELVTIPARHRTIELKWEFNVKKDPNSNTPMEHRLCLKNDGSATVDATMYRSVTGSLCYLVNMRPDDIAHDVGVVNRYIVTSSSQHWAAIKQILRYAQRTLKYGGTDDQLTDILTKVLGRYKFIKIRMKHG